MIPSAVEHARVSWGAEPEVDGLTVSAGANAAHVSAHATRETPFAWIRELAGEPTLWPRHAAHSQFILVSGIPRSGTSWVLRIARNLLRSAGVELHGGPDTDFPTNALGDAEDQRLRAALITHRVRPGPTTLVKTHFYPGSSLTETDPFRVVFVWRDLRDVMASTCVYARYGPAASYFGGMGEDEAHAEVIERVLPTAAAALRHLARGVPHNTLVLRYERLHARLTEQVRALSTHLQIHLPAGFAEAIARRHRFKRESGRAHGQVDVESYHRSGTVGSYAQALSRARLDQIDRMVPDLDALQSTLG